MAKVNSNNGNKTKSDLFKSKSIFIGRKMLKYFHDFYYWHFSISLQK